MCIKQNARNIQILIDRLLDSLFGANFFGKRNDALHGFNASNMKQFWRKTGVAFWLKMFCWYDPKGCGSENTLSLTGSVILKLTIVEPTICIKSLKAFSSRRAPWHSNTSICSVEFIPNVFRTINKNRQFQDLLKTFIRHTHFQKLI